MKKTFLTFVILLNSFMAIQAQDSTKTNAVTTPAVNTSAPAEQVTMATELYKNGNIYVVVGVLAIIFSVLFTYMFMQDKRIKALQKEN